MNLLHLMHYPKWWPRYGYRVSFVIFLWCLVALVTSDIWWQALIYTVMAAVNCFSYLVTRPASGNPANQDLL